MSPVDTAQLRRLEELVGREGGFCFSLLIDLCLGHPLNAEVARGLCFDVFDCWWYSLLSSVIHSKEEPLLRLKLNDDTWKDCGSDDDKALPNNSKQYVDCILNKQRNINYYYFILFL